MPDLVFRKKRIWVGRFDLARSRINRLFNCCYGCLYSCRNSCRYSLLLIRQDSCETVCFTLLLNFIRDVINACHVVWFHSTMRLHKLWSVWDLISRYCES